VEASFAKPVETQEYDVLLPIANDLILDVEVKDYETEPLAAAVVSCSV